MYKKASKGFRLTALALTLALTILAGCGGKPAQSAPQQGAKPEASKEKVLTLSFDVKAVTLDPATSAERTTGVMAEQFYDTLVTRNDKGEFVSKLATAWTNPNPTEWVFTLRSGVKFHDGKAFTAKDVKYTMDRYMDKANKSPMAALYTFLEKVEVKDDQTVIFRTKEQNGTLLSSLAITPILGEKQGVDWAQQVYGTGPFKLGEFKRGEQVVMVKNSDYWGTKPALDKVIWKEIPEQATRIAALERGDLDLVIGLNAEDVLRLQSNKNLKVEQAPTYRIRFLWLNASKKPFSDPKVREAVKMAIDTNALVKDIMGNMAQPATGPLAPGVFGYTAAKPFKYDVVKAKALLAEAGYPNGFETSLDYPLADTKQKELAETIAAQLGEVGIKVKLLQKERAVWLADLTPVLKWDMNLFAHSTTGGDADYTQRRVFHSAAKRTGFANADMDKALDEAAKHTDPAKRLVEYKKANDILWEQGPVVYLFIHTQAYAYGSRVTKFVAPKDDVIKLVDIDVK